MILGLKGKIVAVCCSVVLLVSACDQTNRGADATSTQQTVKEVQVEPALKTSKTSHFIVGTGSVAGVYYPIAGVICRLLNRHKERHKMRCSVESTAGSVYNLKHIGEGDLDLVVAQSDWQYHAYHGSSTFKKIGANPDLRAVFALEADPLALIVKADSGLSSLDDLQNKTVSLGYTRSLQHRIINDLLDAKGWTDDNFKAVKRMRDSKQMPTLCAGEVDAILLLTSSLKEHERNNPNKCDMALLPINGEHLKQVIAGKPYYRMGSIPKGAYFNSQQDIQSFGLGATFVALKQTSPKLIYHVVKEVVENFKDFQSLHSSLQMLDKKELPYAGISAPLHPGAERYYKEARLLK